MSFFISMLYIQGVSSVKKDDIPFFSTQKPTQSTTEPHFYTVFSNEKNSLIYNGWTYEGVGWNAPDEGWYVYRLYNPNTGDHHYTMDTDERDYLVRIGWRDEGTAFASPSLGWENTATAQGKPVYRLYNPNAAVGAHYYTTSAREVNALHRLGWRYEGIGWYAL